MRITGPIYWDSGSRMRLRADSDTRATGAAGEPAPAAGQAERGASAAERGSATLPETQARFAEPGTSQPVRALAHGQSRLRSEREFREPGTQAAVRQGEKLARDLASRWPQLGIAGVAEAAGPPVRTVVGPGIPQEEVSRVRARSEALASHAFGVPEAMAAGKIQLESLKRTGSHLEATLLMRDGAVTWRRSVQIGSDGRPI